MINTLILGSGFVGTNLATNLPKHHHVTLMSNNEFNYRSADNIIKIIKSYKPDYIINACGYTGEPNVDACEDDKDMCWELNVNFPVTLTTISNTYNIPVIHITSGCIYTGYDKMYTETDTPNFGLESDSSSWYSKTKHACEISLKHTESYMLRIRMPFTSQNHGRNFLTKILKYNNLIDYPNSMTCVEDLVIFVDKFINKLRVEYSCLPWNRSIKPGIYNVVNPDPVSIKDCVDIFELYGKGNSKWNFVDIEQLTLKANRSNCILDDSKITKMSLQLPSSKISLRSSIMKLCKDL